MSEADEPLSGEGATFKPERAKAVDAVSEMQRRSTELGTDAMSPEEIDAEIQEVRRARREQARDLADSTG